MGLQKIATVAWGLPPGWLHWTPGSPSEMTPEASALCQDPATTDAVMAAAREFDSILETELPGTAFAAIWAPAATGRRPLASATLRTAAPPATGRMEVEALLSFVRERVSPPRGTRVLDVAALPSRVVAGEAVLRIVDVAPRFRRQVSRQWTWFILPPGTDRTIACQVESSSIAHFDELADMATDIANTVEITVESP